MARLRWLAGPASVAAIALVVRLLWGSGTGNYDSLYALIWGRQLAHGHTPSFDVTLAPTPHPLANLVSMALAPLAPRTAEGVVVVIAFLALGAVGWLTYRLGEHWFGWPAGVLAAVLMLTREPVLSYGTRSYIDVPYLALVLGALLAIARNPRAAGLPLGLLALAGLIRPEAWLFSFAYVAWLIWRGGERRAEWIGLALAAPLLWMAFDLIAVGNPLHSLTGTRHGAQTLGRVTGIQNVPTTLPRRVGEILREPVLVGAVIGLALTWAFLRDRVRLLVIAGVAGVVAYAILGAAGLPILTRYAFFVATLGALLCGAAVFGWRLLPERHAWRRRWIALGALTALLLVVFIPSQAHRLSSTRTALIDQSRIEDDLWALKLPNRCGELGVVNHRLVPVVSLHLGMNPFDVHPAPLPPRFRGQYIEPANAAVAKAFVLDPRDPSQRVAGPPPGLYRAGGNASWRVLQLCPRDVFQRGGE